jgi:UDP-2,4-diacetamido-2,4,6-trideoxy-beta-L-altropyranose hydrolase
MRCLSLAQALAARGAAILFAVEPAQEELVRRFAPGLPARIVPKDAAWDAACEAVVIDDYAVGAAEEGRAGPVLMVIDDLADRPHRADLLLDPGYGRRAGDYAGLLPPGAEVLAGPAYALLRPEFARARDPARPVRDRVERVFVSFGLSDVDGVTAKAVAALRRLAPDVRIDVATGAGAASLPALRADPGVTVHVETADAAGLMAAADVGVGAGGGAIWERCCLGLPSLAVAVADNQRENLARLVADGVVLGADLAAPGWTRELESGFRALQDPARRGALRGAAIALCDGRGAERAATALLARLV